MVKATKYAAELEATAQALCAPGKGLLASDESTGTIGKRLADVGLENTLENRTAYRALLFATPDLASAISGAILFEETLNGAWRGGGECECADKWQTIRCATPSWRPVWCRASSWTRA